MSTGKSLGRYLPVSWLGSGPKRPSARRRLGGCRVPGRNGIGTGDFEMVEEKRSGEKGSGGDEGRGGGARRMSGRGDVRGRKRRRAPSIVHQLGVPATLKE